MPTTLFLTLAHVTCCSCGVVFGIESQHQERLRQTHDDFYCPNGHRQHYTGESDAERERRLREAAERREQMVRDARDREQEMRLRTERRLIAQRAATTRLKRRAAAGTCPCCHRTFKQLAQHMAGQHPEFVKSARIDGPGSTGL